jgi:hypothetical protein
MDFNATIDLIIKDLREASDIIDDLKKYPGVPALQVEMAKLKCRSAGEVIALLKTLKDTAYITDKEPIKEIVTETEPEKEEIKPLPVQEIIKPVRVEKLEEVLEFEPELPPVIEEAVPKKIYKKENESPILADKFSSESNTFNDKPGIKKNEDDISDVLKSQPISSLLQAIGLNDKFIFIREIFNGNQEEYSQAISRLEGAGNLTDAKAVIMSYTGENSESDAVLQLLELVKRKFPSHE